MNPTNNELVTPTYERVRSRSGIKWNRYESDVLPAWVADMDFDPPEAVTDAMRPYLDLGDTGYNIAVRDQLHGAYADWQHRHHNWRPDEDRLRTFTSALHALETALWFRTNPGDGIVVFTPIYHPFLNAIADSGRRLVSVPLDPDGWRIDSERLASAIDSTTKMVLFCQPHNPAGRVFDNEELAAVAEVAERHDLLVVSDEIWGDLTHDRPHQPLATRDDRFAGRLMTLGSASKSFNLAGLRCAVAHIDDVELNRVIDTMPGHLLGAASVMSLAGTHAAWTLCDDWMAAARTEITARRDQLARRLASELPEVTMSPPEATYLGWLDFRATDLGDDPSYRLLKEGRVALSPGPQFGPEGAGYARINFATSAEILDDIIDRIIALVRSTP
jgi:cystathionine beta-lyase